ncbi:MAG: radical SAM family heme chaperone HemW [Clostridiaceae bacterium]|nr:radical SAM family heme chaperone HemW [Clostridiaceae bacterium]
MGCLEKVGIYIHIPFCVKKCNYCDFPSFAGMESLFGDYALALCKEMELATEKYGPVHADTVFVGGGTPSLIPAEYLSIIINALTKFFNISKDAEITLEVNPGTVTAEKAGAYRQLGFNRISIGLQAAQDRILRLMGRIHTKDMFIDCVDLVKRYGFTNINADIIFGIPTQTMEDWAETIHTVIKSDTTHVSCYSLEIGENTPWFEMRERGELPNIDDDLDRQMYDYAIAELGSSGFRHYEISNFSRPGFECKHNIKYWLCKPYLGFGAAAHSFYRNIRSSNLTDPAEYIRILKRGFSPQATAQAVDDKERLSERFILGLRLTDGISLETLEEEFGSEAVNKYKKKIASLEEKKLVCLDNGIMRLTKAGLDYANQVWLEFV